MMMIDFAVIAWGFVWENIIDESPMFVVFIGYVVLLFALYREKPSFNALLPVSAFVVLLFLNMLWSLIVDIPAPAGREIAGQFQPFDETLSPSLMAAMAYAQQLLQQTAAIQGAENADQLVIAVTHPARVDAIDFAKKIFLSCIYGTAAIYAVLWFWRWVTSARIDLLAKFTALGLIFAELWTMFVHVIGCDIILAGMDRTALNRGLMGTYKAVCDREVFWGAEAIPMAAFLGFMVWIYYRFAQAREEADSLED